MPDFLSVDDDPNTSAKPSTLAIEDEFIKDEFDMFIPKTEKESSSNPSKAEQEFLDLEISEEFDDENLDFDIDSPVTEVPDTETIFEWDTLPSEGKHTATWDIDTPTRRPRKPLINRPLQPEIVI